MKIFCEVNELNQVLNFIKGWQERNPYNPSILGAFNCKFKADLKDFFKKSNFNTITIKEINEVLDTE